jgi:tetratricopeptide (TPR) repeat protein/tRNA A-37 threonylcarbamoyl transferase component Bud32
MSCLDENTLVALLERTLSREDQDRVTAHLDRCQACRKLVSAMASWYPAEPAQDRTQPARAPREVGAGAGVLTARPERSSPPRGTPLPPPVATPGEQPKAGELGPGVRVDRYLLLRPIASGGMAVVYAAYDQELDRKLAIKFLRAEVRQPLDDARLLREAQVMARLSHPNVVQLHDVGLYGDRVFLVMELVEGKTLRHWLAQGPHPRGKVLDVLVAAGRGLAAAHRAGVVHRDFKPENVLVGDDGRVRVMDFGLARARDPRLSGEQSTELSGAGLTRPGMVMGTPGYMAPEQLGGGRGDARSDQFAFCCALYEALAGERPFAGTTLEEYTASLARARAVRPLSRRVPARIRRAVSRGLSLEPAARFPSMDEALAALDVPWWQRVDRVDRRVGAAVGAGLLALAAVVAVGAAVGGTGEPCGDPEDELAGVWDEGRRAAVVDAVTRAAGAERAAAAAADLDGLAGRWARTYAAVCEGGGGQRPQAELAAARGCLDRRRADLLAAADLLSSPDPAVARRAVQLAAVPPGPESCADRYAPPQPGLPLDGARRERLQRLRGQVSLARLLVSAGRANDAVTALTAAAADVRASGDAALEPEALFVLAQGQSATAAFAAAERTLLESIWAAERTRHDEQAARSWIALYRLLGAGLHDDARARELRPHAEAAVARVGSPPFLAAELDQAIGAVLVASGQPRPAREHLERSAAALAAAVGDDHPWTAAAFEAVGEALAQAGEVRAAEGALHRAVVSFEKVLGPDHPLTASAQVRYGAARSMLGFHPEAVQRLTAALEVARAQREDPALAFRAAHALGEALRRSGRLMDALARQREALTAAEAVFGPGSPRAATSLTALGDILRGLGEYDQALELHQRAAAVNPLLAEALDGAGTDLRLLGRAAEAVPLHRRALGLKESALGLDHPELGPFLVGLAAALGATGDHAGALAVAQRAVGLLERSHGRDSPRLREGLVTAAAELLALGNTVMALRNLERAVALSPARGVDQVAAAARFSLARALAETGQDRDRSLQLASEARAGYALAGNSREAERVGKWLSKQR